ncbi:hypothetical protein FOA52_005914 [Chlamydomonas sp. UWO 241]|nr:hypothetical protein FOA52_005914 [Chlamydomonas sp. UWO 241]
MPASQMMRNSGLAHQRPIHGTHVSTRSCQVRSATRTSTALNQQHLGACATNSNYGSSSSMRTSTLAATGTTPGNAGAGASTSGQAAWREEFVLKNPLQASTVEVFDTAGNTVKVSELTAGRTVVGLLRHLGCAMCWQQAANLVKLQPQFEALGYKLAIVAIGFPEGGKELCAKLPFPESLLYLDPGMKVFSELHLNAGLNYFFNMATWDGVRGLDKELSKEALARYSFIKPPNATCTLQMGGLYVVDGEKLLYAHMDKGLGNHAPNEAVLAACASA